MSKKMSHGILNYPVQLAVLFTILVIQSGCFEPSPMEMPEALKTPKVISGDKFLMKTTFIENETMGQVTDIAMGELDKEPGVEIGFAGEEGAVFIDKSGKVKKEVTFGYYSSPVNFIDIDNDKEMEYYVRGGWIENVNLLDKNGGVVWKYGGEMPGVDDSDFGDVNGDGIKECVVGFNGGGGVHLLDKDGKNLWSKTDGNVWHVEMVDTNGDGKDEIVHSNAGGEIKVRDDKGNVISQKMPGPYFSSFSIAQWPDKKGKKYALLSEADKIWLINFDGSIAKKYDAPDCGDLGMARGTPVQFKKDAADYFAVVVELDNWHRSILYVYNPESELVFHEILGSTASAIAALPLKNDGTDVLLVGDAGSVWRYETGTEQELKSAWEKYNQAHKSSTEE